MGLVSSALPSGVVTLVLGDLEGSVGLWEHDREAMAAAMSRTDELLEAAVEMHNGARPTEQGEGDNFVIAFSRVSDAVACVCQIQRSFVAEPWPGDLDVRFRIGVHTGEIGIDGSGRYEGPTINRCARIRDLAHGGQVVLSGATAVLSADTMPERASTRRLGVFDLRGMTRPEELHQLCHPELDDGFPLMAPATMSNLPRPASTFIGRDAELAELHALLAASRVVTITGAGGSGKSRLALELAAAQPSATSTWLTELASIRDPELVPQTVADAVRAELGGGADPVEGTVRKLRGRPSLLVLDNCEHLLEQSADVVSRLLRACPDLRVVATSREPLAVDGEVIWAIPSLSMSDAVALFVDRARRADSKFDLTDLSAGPIAEICARVDRLPLAIELASARCRALSVEQISASLSERFRLLTGGTRDALPRQRSLEASVAWSYELLPDRDRLVLARLSVFAGSFSLDGAEAVCAGGEVEPDQVQDTIARLVDRSLLHVEAGDSAVRYRMLETIRVFARERLADIDDPAVVRDRHLQFALHTAKAGGAGFATDADRWGPILTAELDNLRAAMEWAGSTRRPEQVIDLIEHLAGYWLTRAGIHREVDQALRGAIFSDALPPLVRARAMAVAVPIVALGAGDFSAAFDLANDACAFAQHGDTSTPLKVLATAMRALAGVASGRGTNEQIAADLDATLAEAESCDPTTAATLLLRVGSTQIWWSGFDAARLSLERALEVAPEDGYEARIEALIWLLNTGADGRVRAFQETAQRVIETCRALEADTFLSWALQLVGFTEALYGHERAARAHVDEALTVARRAASVLQEYFALRADAMVELRFGAPHTALAKARDVLESSRRMKLGVNETIDTWLAGAAARRSGDREAAREHLDSALTLAADPAVPFVAGRTHMELALLDLADDDVEAAWQHGHDALEVLMAAGDRVGVLDALDVIAAVAAHSNTSEMGARLMGAADACRGELGVVAFTMAADERKGVADALACDVDDYEAHRTQGAAMALDDIVTFARRGRGQRNRPATGWQSLTPTEDDVVRLVAEGLKNAEVAERLLMSVNTVKTHLSHAYAKLGISSRTELVAQAAVHREPSS